MNLQFFVGWANSFIVCPRAVRDTRNRVGTPKVCENPFGAKACPPYALRFMGLNSGEKMAAAVSPGEKPPYPTFPRKREKGQTRKAIFNSCGRGGEREKQSLTPAGEEANESLHEFYVK